VRRNLAKVSPGGHLVGALVPLVARHSAHGARQHASPPFDELLNDDSVEHVIRWL
jgi:hypothetical protein